MTEPVKCAGPKCPTEYHRERNGWWLITDGDKFQVVPWRDQWIGMPGLKPVCSFSCAAKLLDAYMVGALKKKVG